MPEYGDYELHSADSIYQEGLDLLESDHFEEALRAFEFVVREQPYNADAFFHKGVTLTHLSRLDEAMASFRVALEIAPTEVLYHSHYGYALMISGRFDQALEHFDYALDLDPDNPQNKLYKAHVLKEKRRMGEARALFEEILEQRPDDLDVLRHHASLLEEIGEEEQALEEYGRVLKKNPNDTDVIRRKSQIFLRRGNVAEAIKCLRELLALRPDDLSALCMLLESLAAMGKWLAVIAHTTEAIEEGMESSEIYLFRGRAMMEEHRLNQAVLDLRRACQLNDRSARAHSLLAHALMALGSLREALTSIDRALQITPNDRHCLLLKSLLHHKLGEYALELQCLDTQLANNPRDFHLVRRKAETLVTTSDLAGARQTVEEFLTLEPHDPRALLLCAELSEQLGDNSRARACYDSLVQHKPTSVRAYLGYAGFLVRHAAAEEALGILEQASADFPDETVVSSARAAALQALDRHEACVEYLRGVMARVTATSQLQWQLGKSLYALGQYMQALTCFQQARNLDTRCNGNLAPSFRLLVDEAYTLHHLKRTHEAIRLLESHFNQFQRFEQEYLELLGELCEAAGSLARAQALYARALEKSPANAQLHYRLARVNATMRAKKRAVEHLSKALALDGELAAVAEREAAFQRHWTSLSLNRLLNFRLLRHRAKLFAFFGVWVGGILILSYALQP